MRQLEVFFKWVFIISLLITVACYIYKDKFPNPDFYHMAELVEPLQTESDRNPFAIHTNNQTYHIFPRFEYELNGVVVSITKAGQLGDIWHYKRWKDFINVRDICVIWGENVHNGVYQKIKFSSDTWTCWVSMPNQEAVDLFRTEALSNNHLLTKDILIKRALMDAEIGDQIYLKGILADYQNTGNRYKRLTSTTRKDGGNGACETVYVDEFKIVKKANVGVRHLYAFSFWVMIFSGILFCLFFCIAPVKQDH